MARGDALAHGEVAEPGMAVEEMLPLAEFEHDGELGAGDDQPETDPVLLEIFRSETETHLQTLREFLASAPEEEAIPYTDALSRALHTLKGSAHTASIEPIAQIATPLEKYVKTARAEGQSADREVLDLLARAADFIQAGLDQLQDSPQTPLPGADQFTADLENLSLRTLTTDAHEHDLERTRPDPQLIQLFLNEGIDILLDADTILDA